MSEIYDCGVDEIGEDGEEALEVSEERWVIKGPGTGLVSVPLRERERVGESKPVAVDFEISGMVGWDQEELDAGGYKGVPGHGLEGTPRIFVGSLKLFFHGFIGFRWEVC